MEARAGDPVRRPAIPTPEEIRRERAEARGPRLVALCEEVVRQLRASPFCVARVEEDPELVEDLAKTLRTKGWWCSSISDGAVSTLTVKPLCGSCRGEGRVHLERHEEVRECSCCHGRGYE